VSSAGIAAPAVMQYGDAGSAPGGLAPGAGNAAAATSAAGQGFPQTARQESLECQRELSLGRPCLRSHYVIQAIYFNAKRYRSTADCLTRAYTVGLPLELCR
jgi:hypothetical protein